MPYRANIQDGQKQSMIFTPLLGMLTNIFLTDTEPLDTLGYLSVQISTGVRTRFSDRIDDKTHGQKRSLHISIRLQ